MIRGLQIIIIIIIPYKIGKLKIIGIYKRSYQLALIETRMRFLIFKILSVTNNNHPCNKTSDTRNCFSSYNYIHTRIFQPNVHKKHVQDNDEPLDTFNDAFTDRTDEQNSSTLWKFFTHARSHFIQFGEFRKRLFTSCSTLCSHGFRYQRFHHMLTIWCTEITQVIFPV